MNRACSCAMLLTLTLLAARVEAQPPRGGGGGRGPGGGLLGLLAEPSVQTELKLSETSIKDATALLETQRASFEGLRDLEQEERREKMQALTAESQAALTKLLDEAQMKRLKQISWQTRGPQAFRDPEVAMALKLTDDQVSKADGIENDARMEMREIFQEAGGEDVQEEIAELRKEAAKDVLALLSDEQRKTWTDMQGEPFKGEIRRPQFGGRPRREPRGE